MITDQNLKCTINQEKFVTELENLFDLFFIFCCHLINFIDSLVHHGVTGTIHDDRMALVKITLTFLPCLTWFIT